MSVSFATSVMQGIADLGVPTHIEPGAYARGNGQTSAYAGHSVHHTAGGWNDGTDSILISGRAGLSGPLCNTAIWRNGTLALVAAHPANHAGASGGWDTAPLPVTGMFNRLMWGTEVQYPGVTPMSDEQYASALVQAHVVLRVLGKAGDYRWCKFHQGTSIQGKIDPAYATNPVKTYSIAEFRKAIPGEIQARLSGTSSATGDSWQAILDWLRGA